MLRRWGCFSASSFEKVYSVFLIEYVQVSKGLNKHLFFLVESPVHYALDPRRFPDPWGSVVTMAAT